MIYCGAARLMASVQETKDALEAAREQAFKSTELAINAINSVVGLSQWTLAILGIFIAILAIIGITLINRNGVKRAEKVANKRLDSYLKSDKFNDLLETTLDRLARERWQQAIIIQGQLRVDERPHGENPPFPEGQVDQQ